MGPTRVSVLRPKLKPLPPLGEEDEDVARERERVVRGATKGDILVLRDLTKVGAAKGRSGWGAPASPATFLRDLLPLRCTPGRGHLLLTACAWGSPPVR